MKHSGVKVDLVQLVNRIFLLLILVILFNGCISEQKRDVFVKFDAQTVIPYVSNDELHLDEKQILEIEKLVKEHDYLGAIESISEFRYQFSESPFISESYYYSGYCLYQLAQPFKAKYYLKQCIGLKKNDKWQVQSGFLLGRILYKDRSFDETSFYLENALKTLTQIGFQSVPKNQLSMSYLILSEIALNHINDRTLARQYYNNIIFDLLDSEEKIKYKLIEKKINWNYLSKDILGLEDGNISALCVDSDDIWIGTWNGGLARYTLSSGKSEVFTMGETQLIDNAIRAIEVTDKYVWVGTFYGLSLYSKASSEWKTIRQFGSVKPEIISTIKEIGNRVFVGTLGSGLFVYENGLWHHFSKNSISYVLCLEEDGNHLYIGTMTTGINILDLKSYSIENMISLNNRLPSKNITMIIKDEEELWLGSYGKGLFRYDSTTQKLDIFNKSSGEIADDWILCGVKSKKAFYFGTFGGGVSSFIPETRLWKKYGLTDGLRSFDVASMADTESYIYFGTLGEGVSILNE